MGWYAASASRVRIEVCACLAGRALNFNFDHFANGLLARALPTMVDRVTVSEIGLGTSRKTLLLEPAGDFFISRAADSASAYAAAMRKYFQQCRIELKKGGFSGFVLTNVSLGFGMQPMKTYGQGNVLSEASVRMFAYRRLLDCFAQEWTMSESLSSRTAEKLLVLSHKPSPVKTLRRLAPEAGQVGPRQTTEQYQTPFMQALAKPASLMRRTVVIERIMGYLKTQLDAGLKRDLREAKQNLRRGLVPLAIAPTLAEHCVRGLRVAHIGHQIHLNPYPNQLVLCARV